MPLLRRRMTHSLETVAVVNLGGMSGGRLQPDKQIGTFELRGELGRGSMAVVWRAYDPSLDREVAIKEPVLPPESSPDVRAEFAERFVREARAAARLNHPGIVTIYSASLFEGRPRIVMELVEGSTLREVLAGGALDTLQTYAVLDQLLAAAGYAHEHGVTHRDLKPDNVFVTNEGLVKLADFGIAQLGHGGVALTRAGTMLGTPAYMAPEQIRGEPVDVRCDVFALGVIAYECLSGANPFGSEASTHYATIIHRIMSEPTPPLAVGDEPAGPLAGVIMRALEKDRALRFDSATTMLSAWRGALPPTIDTSAALVGLGGAGAVGAAVSKAGEHRHRTQIWGQPAVDEAVPSPPQTTVSGADQDWHTKDVTLVLVANDAGSGVAHSEYRLDDGPWTEGSSLLVAARPDGSADGEHIVEYRSADLAGNLERAQRVTVRIDTRSSTALTEPVEATQERPNKRRAWMIVGAAVAVIALVGVVVGATTLSHGHATPHTSSGPSQGALAEQAATLDRLGEQLDAVLGTYQSVDSSLGKTLAVNQAHVRSWDREWNTRLMRYQRQLAAVEAYNRSPAAQGTPSHSTPPVYDSYGNLRSAGTYVAGTPGHREALPSRPSLPSKISTSVLPQRKKLLTLEARLAAVLTQLRRAHFDAPFSPVDTALQASADAVLSKVRLGLRSLRTAVRYDSKRGQVLESASVNALRDPSLAGSVAKVRELLGRTATSQGVLRQALPWSGTLQ